MSVIPAPAETMPSALQTVRPDSVSPDFKELALYLEGVNPDVLRMAVLDLVEKGGLPEAIVRTAVDQLKKEVHGRLSAAAAVSAAPSFAAPRPELPRKTLAMPVPHVLMAQERGDEDELFI